MKNVRLLSWLLIGIVALAARRPASAQDNATNFINLNAWPLDAADRFVLAYPDTAWTWSYLGLNPARGCPPYRLRQRDQSLDYWRTPGIDVGADWLQASRGGQWVSCYRGHAGTDIPAPPGSPVYAAADGTVVLTEISRDTEGEGALIVVDHHRTLEGVDYTWRARYLHLIDRFPVRSGPVREGQLIGFVADWGLNSHLHFEVQDLFPCQEHCIVNPWGPVYLWVDDNLDGWPDPAPSALAAAPPGQDLAANGDFSQGTSGWLPLGDTTLTATDGLLTFDSPGGPSAWPAVQQYVPYAVAGGASIEAALKLANPSDVTRYAFVTLRGVSGSPRGIGCLFTLPPGAPPTWFAMQGRAESRWANLALTLSSGPAGGSGGVTLAGFSLRLRSSPADARTRCVSPG